MQGSPQIKERGCQTRRTCVGCREKTAPNKLLRFVRDPQGELRIDIRQRMPGRGAYLHLRRACVDSALQSKSFNRSFRAPVAMPGASALVEQMTIAARNRALEHLGLARRAGAVEAGIERVRRGLKHNQISLVMLAADAGHATHEQVVQNCNRKGVPLAHVFDGVALARAIGLDYVAVLGVSGEPFSARLEVSCSILEHLAAGFLR